MKTCSKCNTTNADNAQFCCNCGASLAPPKPKFCIQCGTAVEEGHSFCPKCGTSIGNTQPPQPPYPPVLPQTPKINGMGDAIRVCLKEKYASFNGRATRTEFWWFFLFQYLLFIPAAVIGGCIGAASANYYEVDEWALIGALIGYGIVGLALIVPAICVCVRRLHDTGRSGAWYFISFVPYVGGIVLLVFMLLESQMQDNEYGTYIP